MYDSLSSKILLETSPAEIHLDSIGTESQGSAAATIDLAGFGQGLLQKTYFHFPIFT